MTRIAILSDIHANLFALDAVIEHLADQQVDEVLVGGDLVGRGPLGSAVVERIWEKQWRGVRGNHEDYLLNFHHRRIPETWWTDPVWSASRWMSSELDAAHFDYLAALPFSLNPVSTQDLLLVHGTPLSNQEGIGTWTTEEEMAKTVEGLSPGQMLVCAHTHRPIERHHEGVTVVNTGSVGLPFNGDPRAQYVIITHEQGQSWQVDFMQVDYDREALLTYYQDSGFLALGGITSAMLYQEIIHARPFLVPYLRWAEATKEALDAASIERFLEFYDCQLPLTELFAIFQALGEEN